MSKVLVLYYSTYGHIETMAQAVAEGARASGSMPFRVEVDNIIGNGVYAPLLAPLQVAAGWLADV